jgi:hypothetical protein
VSLATSYACDGPDCQRHVKGNRSNTIPMGCGFITVMQHITPYEQMHFCGWDCVLRYAATIDPETVIYPDGPDEAQQQEGGDRA